MTPKSNPAFILLQPHLKPKDRTNTVYAYSITPLNSCKLFLRFNRMREMYTSIFYISEPIKNLTCALLISFILGICIRGQFTIRRSFNLSPTINRTPAISQVQSLTPVMVIPVNSWILFNILLLLRPALTFLE